MGKQWWARVLVGRTAVSDPQAEQERPDGRFELEWRGIIKRRLWIVLGVLALWVAGLEARLVVLQTVEHDYYVQSAAKQQQDIKDIDPVRGDIRDRNGQLLAYSVESFDVKANPSIVRDPAREAAELCRALRDCSAAELADIAGKLGRTKTRDLVVRAAQDMSPDAVTRVRALIEARQKALKGVSAAVAATMPVPDSLRLVHHPVRYYPKMNVAAHVVGFVKDDGSGAAGVEARFEKQIAGVKGRELVQVDGKTDGIFTRVEREPVPGASLELTIDTRLQQIVERELAAGVRTARAEGGAAVMLDPYTGEILAQASYPSFNPNAPFDGASDADRLNRAVQAIYEPGSTFKIVTASAALNEHVLRPDDLIDTNPGYIIFPGRKPIDEDKKHNYGVLSVEDVIVKSSNVGAVRIGLRVGVDRMYRYVQRYGFGQRLAPDFSGESAGILTPPSKVNDSALASMSMGYQVGVTAMQMASAAAVVANGGVLMQPHVVRAYLRDGRREEVAPKAIGRVIDPETAATITTIMEGVVGSGHGTGDMARLSRYLVAGKTGTAQKVEGNHYSETDYNVSFVGFVPSRQPAFVLLVVVDTPTVGLKYGGKVAAPIFKRIAEASLEYAGVAPTINPTPPIVVASDHQLVQPPARPETPVITRVGGRPVMPDMRGMTLRDAVRMANTLGLSPTAEGDGFVVSQTPAAGEFLSDTGRCTLILRRTVAKTSGGDR